MCKLGISISDKCVTQFADCKHNSMYTSIWWNMNVFLQNNQIVDQNYYFILLYCDKCKCQMPNFGQVRFSCFNTSKRSRLHVSTCMLFVTEVLIATRDII